MFSLHMILKMLSALVGETEEQNTIFSLPYRIAFFFLSSLFFSFFLKLRSHISLHTDNVIIKCNL